MDKTNNIKISVVVPMYNVEKYISECIESIQRQTLSEIEIILIDDGSPDRSGEIADSYAEEDSRITVIHKANGGVSAARNDGMAICSGEYLYIMDSDDYLVPDALESMYACAVKTDADVVISDHFTFRQSAEPQEAHFFSAEIPDGYVTEDEDVIRQMRNMVLCEGYSPFPHKGYMGLGIAAPWTKLLKCSLVTEHQLQFDPYVRGLFDDGLFSLDVFQHAKKVAYIRHGCYYYRILDSSLMRKFNPKRAEINSNVFQRIQEFSLKHQCAENRDFTAAYYGRVIIYLRYLLKTYFCHKDCPLSLNERLEGLKQACLASPYADAIRSVETGKLKSGDKKLVLLLRMKQYKIVFNHYNGKSN